MKQAVSITFSTENDAFRFGGHLEVARILRNLANGIEESGVGFQAYVLHDANGNKVGKAEIYTNDELEG